MNIKAIMKRIIKRQYSSSSIYVEYLRSKGAKIGTDTYFYTPEKKPVDESRLPFLEIGNNCRVTDGAQILLHDYSYAALRPIYHAMLLKAGVTSIGNNVFVGTRAIILMNSHIGDNVIIGAGSVVSGYFDSNVVIAGNPARVICTLEEYYQKCLDRFDNNAKCFYLRQSEFCKRPLKENEMSWFVALWKTNSVAAREELLNTFRVDGDDKYQVVADAMKFPAKYDNYYDFLSSFEHRY